MSRGIASMFLDRLNARLKQFVRCCRRAPGGRVTAIFVADAAGAPMRACERTLALVDQGLSEDRYALGLGFWRLTDGCQVTLILAEELLRAERRHGLPLDAGQHRRNLVVSGLIGVELRGRSLRIGEALLTWHRVRPPCGHLDRVAGAGMAKALGRYGGHCLRVREGGLIRVGDEVTVV
ncbi:MOSC domain-containing protein [Thiocapsa roseopersicina]|uniref:MOSC domain-containing protein n=2 Tax=Thiocapsa roseopersicina TaxID=1058 RepID=A0A1H3DJW9_THIRO|nr:MOSC domain-containing protein [Thiocapsa roseopersicina]